MHSPCIKKSTYRKLCKVYQYGVFAEHVHHNITQHALQLSHVVWKSGVDMSHVVWISAGQEVGYLGSAHPGPGQVAGVQLIKIITAAACNLQHSSQIRSPSSQQI